LRDFVGDAQKLRGGRRFVASTRSHRTRPPSGHHDRCQAIPHQIHGRARHIHDFVYAENDEDAFDGQWKEASVPVRITNDARGTAATPLLVSMSVSIISSCCQRHVDARCLCHEDRGHGKVERAAVEVERVSRRHDEGDDAACTPIASICSMAFGSAASEDVVENAISAGSFTALRKGLSGTRARRATGNSTSNPKTTARHTA